MQARPSTSRKGLINITAYLDNASTTCVRDEVRDIIISIMCDNYGNPSSSHTMGRRAKFALDVARKNIAAALGAGTDEIIFTSGGTEADNWAILGAAESYHRHGRHMITALSEHDAVRKPAELLARKGWEVTYLHPDRTGRISTEAFIEAIRDDTALASIMLVNNETGTVNPIGEMSRALKRRNPYSIFHTDAVQGFMKQPFTATSLGADLVSISAHKVHGPKGVGALYIQKGTKLPPLLFGGGQEREKRSGTEALPSIAGFGEAVRLAALERHETYARVQALYDLTVARLSRQLPNAVIISPGDSPFILSFSLPGSNSEVLMNCLEADGIYVSKSSACKKGARSHVLEAMRLPNAVIDGALRVSFSSFSKSEDVEFFIDKLTDAVARLRKR